MELVIKDEKTYFYENETSKNEGKLKILNTKDFFKHMTNYISTPASFRKILKQTLPDGVRFVRTYKLDGDQYINLTLEEPPRIKHIFVAENTTFISEMLEKQLNPLKIRSEFLKQLRFTDKLSTKTSTKNVWVFKLFFPYIIYNIELYLRNNDLCRLNDIKVGLRKSPIETINDMIYYPPISNLFEDLRNCVGSEMNSGIHNLFEIWGYIDSFWKNVFNDDLSKSINNYKIKQSIFSDYFLWHKISKKNPYMILNENLIPCKPLNDLIDKPLISNKVIKDIIDGIIVYDNADMNIELILNTVTYNKYDIFKIGRYKYEIQNVAYTRSNIRRESEKEIIKKIEKKDNFALMNYINKISIIANNLELNKTVKIFLGPEVYQEITKNRSVQFESQLKVKGINYKKNDIITMSNRPDQLFLLEKIRQHDNIIVFYLKTKYNRFSVLYDNETENLYSKFNKKELYSFINNGDKNKKIKSGEEVLLLQSFDNNFFPNAYQRTYIRDLNEKVYFKDMKINDLSIFKYANIKLNQFIYKDIKLNSFYKLCQSDIFDNLKFSYFKIFGEKIKYIHDDNNCIAQRYEIDHRNIFNYDSKYKSILDAFKEEFIHNDTFIIKKDGNKDIEYKIGEEYLIYPYFSPRSRIYIPILKNYLKGDIETFNESILNNVETDDFHNNLTEYFNLNIYIGGNKLFEDYINKEDIEIDDKFNCDEKYFDLKINKVLELPKNHDEYFKIWKLKSFNVTEFDSVNAIFHCYFNFQNENGECRSINILNYNTNNTPMINTYSFRKIKRNIKKDNFELSINDMIQIKENKFDGYKKSKRYLVKAIIIDDEDPAFQPLVLTHNLQTLYLNIVEKYFNVYKKDDRKYNLKMLDDNFGNTLQYQDLIFNYSKSYYYPYVAMRNIDERCYAEHNPYYYQIAATYLSQRLNTLKLKWSYKFNSISENDINMFGRNLKMEKFILKYYDMEENENV